MKKKVLSCVLAASMLLSMTACGNSGSNVGSSASSADTAAAAQTAESKETATDQAAADVSQLEPVTLKMYFDGSNVTDDSQVLDAANAYLKEKLNVTLEPVWGTWADFDTNSVLSLQGGDDVDIYFTSSWSADEYNKFARDGYWVRLDDPNNNMIEKYAPELWKTLPQVLINGASINGSDGFGVYAVPGYKDIATQNCWDINVTKLKELGYTLDDIKNADYYTFGDILKKAKEKAGNPPCGNQPASSGSLIRSRPWQPSCHGKNRTG